MNNIPVPTVTMILHQSTSYDKRRIQFYKYILGSVVNIIFNNTEAHELGHSFNKQHIFLCNLESDNMENNSIGYIIYYHHRLTLLLCL